MIRATKRNADGTYTSDLSKDELLAILGKLEDNGLPVATLAVNDECYVILTSVNDRKARVVKGYVTKVLNSKKEGVRYDVWMDGEGYRNLGYFERFTADHVYKTAKEAQVVADKKTEELQERLRHDDFLTVCTKAKLDCQFSLDLPKTEEEKVWFAEYLEEEKRDLPFKEQQLYFRMQNNVDSIARLAKTIEHNKLSDYAVYEFIRISQWRQDDYADVKRHNAFKAVLGLETTLEVPECSEELETIRKAVEPILNLFK